MNTDDQRSIAEWYAIATTHGNLHFGMTIKNCAPGYEGQSVRLSSNALTVICAAGMAGHWGTSLFRLKYANDASEYRGVRDRFQVMAVETSRRLNWGCDELAHFLADFVLIGWLLDRPFRGKGEWTRRCSILRNRLFREERKASSFIALRLGRHVSESMLDD